MLETRSGSPVLAVPGTFPAEGDAWQGSAWRHEGLIVPDNWHAPKERRQHYGVLSPWCIYRTV